MPNALLHIVDSAVRGNPAAQFMGRFGLSEPGNIVVLAFHRHQRHPRDLRRVDQLAAMGHLALWQRMLDENDIDRLQIVLRSEVHDREIFVIEVTVLVDQIAVALYEVLEQVLVRVHVAVKVHADEAVELQEARIDITHHARVRERHLGDDVVAEPLDAALGGEIVHGGRIATGIDRPPIKVIDSGTKGSRLASMMETAATTGTEGWQTAITCMLPPSSCSISMT